MDFIEDNPDLARSTKGANKLISELSTEAKYGAPALLAQEYEQEKQHEAFLKEIEKAKETNPAKVWEAQQRYLLNKKRQNPLAEPFN